MSRANPRFRRQNQKLPSPANEVYRVKLYGSLESQLCISTFWYRSGSPPGGATLTHFTNLYNALVLPANLMAAYLQCCSVDYAFTKVIIDSPTSPTVSAATFINTAAGTGAAGHEPTEVASVFIRYTGTKGQCGRGRVELPAVPTTVVTASKITSMTNYTAFATNMLQVITSGGDTFTPGLYSRNGSRAFPGSGYADLVSCIASPLLGTIRRRKIGRGK